MSGEKRVHGSSAAGAGDIGSVDDGDLLARMITHPIPFCTYYGETDPTTIERGVHRAREKEEQA
jgi:hypothetical protein